MIKPLWFGGWQRGASVDLWLQWWTKTESCNDCTWSRSCPASSWNASKPRSDLAERTSLFRPASVDPGWLIHASHGLEKQRKRDKSKSHQSHPRFIIQYFNEFNTFAFMTFHPSWWDPFSSCGYLTEHDITGIFFQNCQPSETCNKHSRWPCTCHPCRAQCSCGVYRRSHPLHRANDVETWFFCDCLMLLDLSL